MHQRFSVKHDFLSVYFNVPVSMRHSLFFIFMSPPWHFFKSAAVLLLPKDLQDFPLNKFSSPSRTLLYPCIPDLLTSPCLTPDLCPYVCVTGVRGWCGACAWAVAWRPDPSAGDGGHGTAAAPCPSLSPPRCLQRPQGPTLPKVPAQSWKQHSR